MFSHVTYARSMDSIQSHREALTYKKEAIDIPLSLLANLVPEEMMALLKEQTFGVGIYTHDGITPDFVIGSNDVFYKRNDQGVMEITPPIRGMDPSKIWYSPAYMIRENPHHQPLTLERMFGQSVTLSRTLSGCRKALGAHAFCFYLESLGLYKVYTDVHLPSLNALAPSLSLDSWKNYKTQEFLTKLSRIEREQGTIVLSENEEIVDETEYNSDVLRALGKHLNPLLTSMSDFYEYDRDCFYWVELQKNHLRLIKGIDHKYLPYYELKFPDNA